jgi:hypothetical protein
MSKKPNIKWSKYGLLQLGARKKVNIAPSFALGLEENFPAIKISRTMEREPMQYLTLRMEGGLHVGYNTDRFLFGGK